MATILVAIIATVNLALGYALAIYLGHARAGRETVADEAIAEPMDSAAAMADETPASALPPAARAAPIATFGASPAAMAPAANGDLPAVDSRLNEIATARPVTVLSAPDAAQASAMPATTSPPPLAATVAAEVAPTQSVAAASKLTMPAAPEVEQDLLAGIEEFRNQLAQMNACGGEGPATAAAAKAEEALAKN